jgi:elongation factor P hydroxylase
MATIHCIVQLKSIFEEVFLESENTVLQAGASEPFYQASSENKPAIIFSREDFFSSALHEIAHWCIAGKERRQQDDFGYWYEPDGRNQQQQREFEKVEVKPQAIEWLFSLACSHSFNFSADNLDSSQGCSTEFKRKVYLQALDYLNNGLPARAQLFFDSLNSNYRQGKKVELTYV